MGSTVDPTKSASPSTTAVSRSTLPTSTAEAVSSSFYETFSLCPFCIVGQQRKQRTWLAAQVKCLSAGTAVKAIHPQEGHQGVRGRSAVFALGPRGDVGDLSASVPRDTPGVWLCAKCQIHGDIQTMYCSDVTFFQKLFRYNVVLEDQLATGGGAADTESAAVAGGAELRQQVNNQTSSRQQTPPISSKSTFHSMEHYDQVMAYAKLSRQNSDEIVRCVLFFVLASSAVAAVFSAAGWCQSQGPRARHAFVVRASVTCCWPMPSCFRTNDCRYCHVCVDAFSCRRKSMAGTFGSTAQCPRPIRYVCSLANCCPPVS